MNPMITPVASLITALLITLGFPIPTSIGADQLPEEPPIVQITPEIAREIVKAAAQELEWTGRQWQCLDTLIDNESRWNYEADNKHSSAYGLFQVLDTPHGLPIELQIDRGFRYINTRYGSPCQALAFWNKADRRGTPWY